MANSLREDVEALAAEWASAAERGAKFSPTPTLLRADLASQALRRILDRHPAADVVVVPVARFTDQQVSEWMERHGLEAHPESDMRCAMDDAASLQWQADAILSNAGIERAEAKP